MKTLMNQFVLILNLVTFPTVQSHALTAHTQMSLTTLQSDEAFLDQVSEQIDARLNELASIEKNASTHSKKFIRKEHRWNKILTQRSGFMVNAIHSEIDSMTDYEADQKVLSIHANPAEGANSKEILKNTVAARMPTLISKASTQIAEAGGIVPFMLTAKKQIAQMKRELAQSKNKTLNRAPAQIGELYVTMALLLVLSIIGIIFGTPGMKIAGILVAGGIIALVVISGGLWED